MEPSQGVQPELPGVGRVLFGITACLVDSFACLAASATLSAASLAFFLASLARLLIGFHIASEMRAALPSSSENLAQQKLNAKDCR
jgi:uncharacterized integral membrane protein